MDSSSTMIFNPFNYDEGKAKTGILLRSKGLYGVTLALENEPNATVKKDMWHNKLDESYGLFPPCISPNILFHIDGLTTTNQVWTKIESLFGVQDELRVHWLEIEFISISPSSFDSIEGLFTKFKSLVLMLKHCII